MDPPDTPDRSTAAALDSSESSGVTFDLSDMDVPLDIWVEVVMNLTPNGVLSLASTCKALHTALHQKGVWLQILRNVCRAYGIFLPTFPFGHMSLSEMRAAALRPGRLSEGLKLSGDDEWVFYRPGGDFSLLAAPGQPAACRSGTLGTLDVGTLRCPGWWLPIPPRMVAGMTQDVSSSEHSVATVLSISPIAEDATFSESGTLRIEACNEGRIADPCIRESHVMFFFKNTFILWKYLDREVIRWTLPVRDYVGASACLPHSELVVCMTRQAYSGWKLPPSGERMVLNGSLVIPDPSLSPFHIPPDFTVSFPFGPDAMFSELSFLANACPTRLSPVRLNIGHEFNLYRYHVVIPPASAGEDSFDVKALTIAGCLMWNPRSDVRATDCIGGGLIFQRGKKAGHTYIYEGTPYAHDGVVVRGRVMPCRTVKFKNPDGYDRVIPLSACTLSGRVLYRADADTLACVDYLPSLEFTVYSSVVYSYRRLTTLSGELHTSPVSIEEVNGETLCQFPRPSLDPSEFKKVVHLHSVARWLPYRNRQSQYTEAERTVTLSKTDTSGAEHNRFLRTSYRPANGDQVVNVQSPLPESPSPRHPLTLILVLAGTIGTIARYDGILYLVLREGIAHS
ncbi:hypothetical protein NMY22_g2119 [Coprinellus aureogranulatus]|nr:hypothetical protein NMY22_g2119 [Coprinellus aureogranulatus]